MREGERERPSWEQTWMEVAESMAKRSRCSRAQVGAVIVNRHQRIVSSSYNGPAATYRPANGLDNNSNCRSWCPRARGETPLDAMYDACPAIHAEENSIAFVDRTAVEHGTIYVTGSCCMRCAKLISNSGIARVVMRVLEGDAHRRPEDVIAYLRVCGLSVVVLDGERVSYGA